MMGHREKLAGGDEYSAFTNWRRLLRWAPHVRKAIKRKFWKRARKDARREAEKEAAE